MKNLILISLILIFFKDVSAQGEKYNYIDLMRPAAIQDKIKDANRLIDICPNIWQYIGLPTKLSKQLDNIKKEDFPLSYHTYPPSGYSMMLDFVSIEISCTKNEKQIGVKSTGEYFSNEQKKLLLSLETGASITVNIQFKLNEKYQQQLNEDLINGMVSMTIVPSKSAMFTGNVKKFNEYLDLKIFDKIVNSTDLARIANMELKFTIDSYGKVSKVSIIHGSGKKELDVLVLNAFKSMPNWQAAQNNLGTKIEQIFEFKFRTDGC
jgi:TonB family protein